MVGAARASPARANEVGATGGARARATHVHVAAAVVVVVPVAMWSRTSTRVEMRLHLSAHASVARRATYVCALTRLAEIASASASSAEESVVETRIGTPVVGEIARRQTANAHRADMSVVMMVATQAAGLPK